jgi:hypothetical protein
MAAGSVSFNSSFMDFINLKFHRFLAKLAEELILSLPPPEEICQLLKMRITWWEKWETLLLSRRREVKERTCSEMIWKGLSSYASTENFRS